jgi:hypothetical protein
LGEQGKLPRRLGFVHPGDEARWDDLPAEANARHAVGNLLAAGAITAEAIIDPSGLRVPVPAHYWSSSSADATMRGGLLDLSVLGFDNDLHIAHVILEISAVAAALGFRLALDEPEATAPKEGAATEAPSAPDPLTSEGTTPAPRKPYDYGTAKAEFAARKLAWDKGGRNTPAPTEKDIIEILRHRYGEGWTRPHVREFRDFWPKEFRGPGPRKRSRQN